MAFKLSNLVPWMQKDSKVDSRDSDSTGKDEQGSARPADAGRDEDGRASGTSDRAESAPEQFELLPPDYPVLELATLTSAPFHVHMEADLYGGGAKPFCFREYERDAKKRADILRKIPDTSIDGSVQVWVSKDRLEAWMTVYPASNEGVPATPEMIDQAITNSGVKEGIIDESVSKAKTPQGMLYLLPLAKGRPAINGEDGRIVSLIGDKEKKFEADDTGKINFAEMNWIINVVRGERICQIIHPTDGTPGLDICGNEITARRGRPAPRVNGKNTSVLDLEDGTSFVVADEEGQLLHTGNKYSVNQVLTIRGDVDYSTGNIKSHSTVIIDGGIKPNFRVETTKDVIVRGSVEWGTIIAGHDITVLGGVMAGDDDYLQAGNDIRCKFMENGRAYCGGNAYFENVVLCNIESEGSIYVTSGRGTAIAGCLRAMGEIRINTVGNRSYRATDVRLAPTDRFTEKLEAYKTEAEAAESMATAAAENLRRLAKAPPSPKAREAKIQQKSIQDTANMKLDNLRAKIDSMSKKMSEVKKHRITVDKAYPNVTISIGNESWPLQQEARYATFILRDHEIAMVSSS